MQSCDQSPVDRRFSLPPSQAAPLQSRTVVYTLIGWRDEMYGIALCASGVSTISRDMIGWNPRRGFPQCGETKHLLTNAEFRGLTGEELECGYSNHQKVIDSMSTGQKGRAGTCGLCGSNFWAS